MADYTDYTDCNVDADYTIIFHDESWFPGSRVLFRGPFVASTVNITITGETEEDKEPYLI